jgi:hypothetical protein
MSKAKKITKKELESIKELQNNLNNTIQNVGVLEAQKHRFLHEVAERNKEIEDLKVKLESKYGSVNISLEDGTYTDAKEDVESDKKD